MRGCFTIHYNGETSPGSTPRSERLKPFLSGLRKVCDISIRLRHRTPSNPWVQDVLQWRVFEALLYSVRTDLRLADPAVTIFNACSSSVLKFRCFSCTVLTQCLQLVRIRPYLYGIYVHCTDIRKLRFIIRKTSSRRAPVASGRKRLRDTRDLSRVVSVQQLQYVRWCQW